MSNRLPAKLTDQINELHVDQDLKNKTLKRETNLLPSGTAKKDYSQIIDQVFSATSQMSPENLKNYVLRSSANPDQKHSAEDDEGEEGQSSNVYQKKGQESINPIPNPLENVRHQHLILQPND